MSMARSNEPLWWGPFSAGMMIGGLCIPALIVITGLLIPVGCLGDSEKVRSLVNHPLTRAFLFVVIASSLFHWAHRFRYILFDLGLRGGRQVVAFLCYGSAVAGTVVTAALALHLF
jgi:fumarate reductase subunit D